MSTTARIKQMFLSVIVLALSAVAPWAHAETRTVRFSGTIFDSPFATGELANGATVSGNYTYESTSAPTATGPNYAEYNLSGGQLDAAASSWISNNVRLETVHDIGIDLVTGGFYPSSDAYMVSFYGQLTGPAVLGYSMAVANLFLIDTDQSIYSDLNFTIDPPDISLVEGAVLQLNLLAQDDQVAYVYAHINSLQIEPPNNPPAILALLVPAAPVRIGHTVSASATFTDPDANDVHTAVFSWGDGRSSTGTVVEQATGGVVSGTHVYNAPGVYIVSVNVTDAAGASAQTSSTPVVIYDANGDDVDGVGWINSPPGAYVGHPNVSGKVTFDFDPKYQHGAAVPSGKTQFEFPAAGLRFHATSYDWLVVVGDKAQLKGTGTINGAGHYAFLLTAIDGKRSKHGSDRLRLKVWDGASGNLVFDNQPGAPDSAPVTAIGGGRIEIHND